MKVYEDRRVAKEPDSSIAQGSIACSASATGTREGCGPRRNLHHSLRSGQETGHATAVPAWICRQPVPTRLYKTQAIQTLVHSISAKARPPCHCQEDHQVISCCLYSWSIDLLSHLGLDHCTAPHVAPRAACLRRAGCRARNLVLGIPEGDNEERGTNGENSISQAEGHS